VVTNFIGEYNHIYFIFGDGGRIVAVQDRAHRQPPVEFVESPLVDHDGDRAASEFSVSMVDRGEPGEFTVGGTVLNGTGVEHHRGPAGFDRALRYRLVDSPAPYTLAVALTVELPERVRYRVRWNATASTDNRFTLAPDTFVTVLTDLPWRWEDSAVVVDTGETKGAVTFLVTSGPPVTQLRDIVVVAVQGHERDALLARAACGRGFVPCFVVSSAQAANLAFLRTMLADVPHRIALGVGLPPGHALDEVASALLEVPACNGSSAPLRGVIGREPGAFTLRSPDRIEAYGPALYLALLHDADLVFDATIVDTLQMTDVQDHPIRDWALPDLLGTVLSPITGDDDKGSPELVICESTLAGLGACQAVGYADLRSCPIAFVRPAPIGAAASGFPDGATGIAALEEVSATIVPYELRKPDASILTVFTDQVPLHLTPVPSTSPVEYWFDRYHVVHLPGQSASQLVPRSFAGILAGAPSVSFGLIFDALDAISDTEGPVYERWLSAGLSYPIVLSGRKARRAAVEELVSRFDLDLLLMVAHGSEDNFRDVEGEPITSDDIGTWQLAGRPIVFNNSCSSITTTGQAFLAAGARAYIGTLWPIANEPATAIGARLAAGLDAEDVPLAYLFSSSVRQVAQARSHTLETASAYVYVGLPDTQPSVRPSLNSEEMIHALMLTMEKAYACLYELADDGRPDIAAAIHPSLTTALRERFRALIVPGEIQPHLPPPLSVLSLLDLDFYLAHADFELGRRLLLALPDQHHPGIVRSMNNRLRNAFNELSTWNERHHRHLHPDDPDAQPVDALGDQTFLMLAGQLVLDNVLPFINVLSGLGGEFVDEAKSWLHVAALAVTTRQDLSPDGSVSDDVLIARIQSGITQEFQVLWTPDGNDNRPATIDLLDQAVNKAELANRFGISLLRMGEAVRAQAFFQAAIDLAPEGSDYRANAESNLINARRTGTRTRAAASFEAALRDQWRLRDYRNASVTAANMIRAAADAGERIGEHLLDQALSHLEDIDEPSVREDQRCSLLGALGCYRASRGDHQTASEINTHITQLVGQLHAAPRRHLMQLTRWYIERGDYQRAYRLALADADRLEHAGLLDPAARSYLVAGHAAISKYKQTHERANLRHFLDCSARLARLLRSRSHLRAGLVDPADEMLAQTRSLRDQASRLGHPALALAAFHALREWDPHTTEPEWDLLSYAFHPRNIESIHSLAAAGALRRSATIAIDPDRSARISVTTSRSARPATPDPRLVYGYLPLYPNVEPDSGDGVARAGGAAVYELPDGASVTVHTRTVTTVSTSDDGRLLFREIWGSRLIPYEVTLHLPASYMPVAARCNWIAGAEPIITIRWQRGQCRLRVDAGGAPWLGELLIAAAPAPLPLVEVLSKPNSPFVTDRPFIEYAAILQMLGR
jgi:hypothetical protein